MKNWSAFYLALMVAFVFALIGFFYLYPGIYHPFSADTFSHTTGHLKHAAAFWVLAVLAIVLSRYVGPRDQAP